MSLSQEVSDTIGNKIRNDNININFSFLYQCLLLLTTVPKCLHRSDNKNNKGRKREKRLHIHALISLTSLTH